MIPIYIPLIATPGIGEGGVKCPGEVSVIEATDTAKPLPVA
jgi:hypothetical protein